MSQEEENRIMRQCLIALVSNGDVGMDQHVYKMESGKRWVMAGMGPLELSSTVKIERLKIYGGTYFPIKGFEFIFELLDNGRDVVCPEGLDIVIRGMIFKDGLDTQGLNPVLMSSVRRSVLASRIAEKDARHEDPTTRKM